MRGILAKRRQTKQVCVRYREQREQLRFELLESRLVLSGDVGLVGDWHTFGNGPGHTGYFPGSFGDDPQAALRWDVDFSTNLNQVAIADGRVYLTPDIRFDDTFAAALDEETGEELWRQTFAEANSINPPTYDNGYVYFQRGNHSSDTQLWSLNSETGLANWSSSHGAQWQNYFAPTVADGRIWINGGSYGGIYGFDQTNGAQLFFGRLPQYDEWTPTYFNGQVYSYVEGVFAEHHPTSGEVQWSVDIGWDWRGWSMNTVSAIADGRAYVVGSPGLHAIDLVTQEKSWEVSGSFQGTPAVAGGKVYSIEQGILKVFDATTGAPQGVFISTEPLWRQQPIVTDDAIIVRSEDATHIYDLDSRAELLRLPVGGHLSLANDTLFIAGFQKLSAYDLLLLPSLNLDGPTVATEGDPGGTVNWTVTVEDAPTSDLTIQLHSSNTDEVVMPDSVVIAAGTTKANIELTILDDKNLDWTQTTQVTASTSGYYDGAAWITVHDNETTTLSVELPDAGQEGDGVLLAGGTIRTAVAPTRDIEIELTSSDSTEVRVPAKVTLPAGSMSVSFDVTIVDELNVDGPQYAEVMATVAGWTAGSAMIRVEDDETPFLTLETPNAATEGDGTFTSRVGVPYVLEDDIVIQLESSDPSELTVPPTVTLKAGELSVPFEVTVVDDMLLDGSQSVSLSASSTGFVSDRARLALHDDESATLTLELPSEVIEGAGVASEQARVKISTTPNEDVVVELQSDSRDRLQFPQFVTIQAGSDFAAFDLSVADDRRVNGEQQTSISAHVVGWEAARSTLTILDNDVVGLSGEWHTFGNGPSHSGYFPGFFGTEPQSKLRWSVDFGGTPNQVAVADGRVYVTPYVRFSGTYAVALDELSGTELWRRDFDDAHSINPPTFSGGNVYLQRGNHASDTQLWALDATSGNAKWSSPHSAQWERYFAPTVADGKIWINGGSYGGMYGFDESDGGQLFFESLAQYDEWTPTYYQGEIYSFVAGVFAAHSPTSGDISWSVDLGWDWHGWSMDTVSAIADDRAYLIGSPGLHAVDLQTQKKLWSVDQSFSGSPAIAGDTVYAIQGGQLKAYDATTGQPSGVFDGGDSLLGTQPIVTDDAIIVASSSTTFIFDRTTQDVLLTLPHGGQLSLSNDTLYISHDRALYAYDFRAARVPWQNFRNHHDVTADGTVSPLDALHVINRLNVDGGGSLDGEGPEDSTYYDVNGDNSVSPMDALLVINFLNRQNGSGEGEGEAALGLSPPTLMGVPAYHSQLTVIGPQWSGRQTWDSSLERTRNANGQYQSPTELLPAQGPFRVTKAPSQPVGCDYAPSIDAELLSQELFSDQLLEILANDTGIQELCPRMS